MNVPFFKTGNAAFKKALNEVAEFARKHGVNPAGAPGWSQSEDGWVPPGGSTGSAPAAAKQWQLRVTTEEGAETRIAQIRGGALYGLNFSGFNLGEYFEGIDWAANQWITISELPGFPTNATAQVWIKLKVKIIGAPFTYYISPDQTETIYLPSQVDESTVELFFDQVGDALPEVIVPTIDPESGESDVEGEYYLRVGSVNIETFSKANDFIGPLGIGWCPPSGPYLVELTT